MWVHIINIHIGYFHNRASKNLRELRGLDGEMVSGEDEIASLAVEYY